MGTVELQTLAEFFVRGAGRGGGERHARHPGESLTEVAQCEVVGAEVVAPLRHAVRLVDRDDAERAALQQCRGLPIRQPLRCDVDEIELACDVCPLHLGALGCRLRRVQIRRVHAVGAQRVDLIVHECDQRADHESGALAHERGHLVGDALSGAGRHQHDSIPTADHLIDDRLLVAAERVVSEDRVQRLTRGRIARRRRAFSVP